MWRYRLGFGTLVACVAGCPSTPPPACIKVDTSCIPGYVPDFDDVYSNTIGPTCAQSASCHSSTGHAANLDMSSESLAYEQLMQSSSIDPKRLRVVPGDPACSLLIVRTDSPGADYQMPKGAALMAPERCALVQWVACGALGPGQGSGCP
jgi:hypothetical protein